ncbi:MAG: hypothetical protein ACE15D_16250 [Candidatus Eisenbacteria bacterium]
MLLLLPFAIVLEVLVPGPVVAATQIGIRGGWSHASRDVFPGSGDLGGSGLYGFTGSIGLLPMLDVEFAYERYTNDFSFDSAHFEDTLFGGKGSYEDQAYLVTGKLHLPFLAAPFGLYAGGGGSLHHINFHVTAADDSFDDIADQLGDERNEWEWHIVAGSSFRIPVLPVAAYAEYRFQNVSGNGAPRYHSIYGGLNLVFE